MKGFVFLSLKHYFNLIRQGLNDLFGNRVLANLKCILFIILMGKSYNFYLAFLLLISFLEWGCGKDESLGPSFQFKDNALICYDFSVEQVEMEGDYLFIRDLEDIYIFRFDGEPKLVQKIDLAPHSTSLHMNVHGDVLAVGRTDALYVGKVYIYKRNNNYWELNQTIHPDKHEDNFGCSIDFNDTLMVIGADAKWNDIGLPGGNTDLGRIYIYRNKGSQWFQEVELVAGNGGGGDNFGQTVALYKDLVLAGPILEVFKFSNTWQSLRRENALTACSVYHDQQNFILYDKSLYPRILSVKIEPDGSFTDQMINFTFDDTKLSATGEKICMNEGLCLVSTYYCTNLAVLQVENNQWNEVLQIGPNDGLDVEVRALAISYPFIIFGGPSLRSLGISIVYFVQ